MQDDPIWGFAPYSDDVRPEWMVLGKQHADRARQFKPFAALRGYDEMVERVIANALLEEDGDEEDLLDVP